MTVFTLLREELAERICGEETGRTPEHSQREMVYKYIWLSPIQERPHEVLDLQAAKKVASESFMRGGG